MRYIGRGLWGMGLIVAGLALAAPAAHAEVVSRTETGFVVRLASEVSATPAEAWKTILTPAQWWQSQHTFSGDAANLSLDPQVGGCFCEVLPRPDGAPATQKPGGVQHMRVIYIEPPRAMRLVGALGPLQSEALSATMTITVKPTEKGSRILFEYVVGGFMRYKVDEIAPAVDRMLTAQLASLAGKLGPIADPAPKPAPEGDAAAKGEPAPSVEPLKGAETFSLPPKGGKPAPKGGAKPEAKPAPKPDAAPAPAPATAATKTAATPAPAAKAPVKAGYLPPAKSVAAAPAKTPAKTPAKAAARPGTKPSTKPAAKAPDPEVDAHRDANAAFDAALGAAPAP
ncbi:SRPBCC family protein [Novosphingobium sp.]|uniref:SRPBCC family protein n=1 Tax=Novosphingobium sp. TaxID=1874826 RepID=UPI003BAC3471